MRISDLLAGGDEGIPGEPEESAAEAATQSVGGPSSGAELLAADTDPDLIEDAEIVEPAGGPSPAGAVTAPAGFTVPTYAGPSGAGSDPADLVEDAEIVDESEGMDHAEVGGSAADATSETAPPLVAPVLAAPTDPKDDLLPRRSY